MTQATPANPLLIKVAILIRDIMGMNESLIKIGRQNMSQEDFETSYIVVDQLGSNIAESSNESFDGTSETMHYNTMFKTEITIDFLGNNAFVNSNRLTGLLRSQAAFEKKETLGIGVYRVSQLTDLKQLTGQQYGNRLQMTLMVQDNRTVDVATLRIDTAQFEFLTQDAVILKPD